MDKLAGASILVVAVILLMSFGQLEAQDRQIQTCRTEGQMAFLQSGQPWNEEGSFSPGNQYVALCMRKSGYTFNFNGKFCQPSNGGEIQNKFCYRSTNFPFLSSINIALKGGYDDPIATLWCENMRKITKDYCGSRGWFTD